MGIVGSSVNFTWPFTGDPSTIDWGIMKAGSAHVLNQISVFCLWIEGVPKRL